MKNLLLLFLLVYAGYANAQMNGNHFRPEKADTIIVSGKVIVDESFQHAIYYLDTNNDSQSDYFLNFGPWWYQPDSTTAQRPINGDEITVTGGKFQMNMNQYPAIIVYEINGEFWRDPFFAEWNNMGHHNHGYGWMGHGHYHGGYGFGWGHDTLITTELTGTALIDTTFYMNHYYLDTNNDAQPDCFLNFGPFWYTPESGAVRPADGETITIKGGMLGRDTTLPMIIVYEINGLTWRDSTKLFPHLGGMWVNSDDSSKRFCSPFDYDDNVQMHKGWRMGGGGHMNRDSLFCQMFESYPENMPNHNGMNFFAGYEVNMFTPDGRNGMWGGEHGGGHMNFANNMNFQFHYTDEQLKYYNMSEDNISIMSWDSELNTWESINGTVDKENNFVTFNTSTAGNYYALSSQSLTDVQDIRSTPVKFKLEQNYPNPFNPATSIAYNIPSDGLVTLKIYDVMGNEITTLVNEYKSAGSYNINYNAANLASGVYFYKITAGRFTDTKKLVLMK